MALNPLIIVLYVKLFAKHETNFTRLIVSVLPAALLLSFASLSTHNLLYIFPLLGVVTMYFLISAKSIRRKSVIMSAVVFVMIYAGINAYWIIPNALRFALTDVQPSYSFSIAEIERLSARNSPSNTILMSGGGAWNEVILEPPNDLNMTLYSLVPIFALFSLLFIQRHKLLIFFGLLFIFVFLLTLGTNAPVPIYQWLLSSPLAGIVWLFRDPYRLVQFTVLAFTLLLSYSLYRIVTMRSKLREIAIICIAAAVLMSPAAYTFANGAGNRLIPSQLPSEYEQVRNVLLSDSDTFRVLWLPLRQYQFQFRLLG
jgi:hypothetical protein